MEHAGGRGGLVLFRRYLAAPSTRFALCIGALMYVSYAAGHDAWRNGGLAGVSAFVAVFLPHYARLSNKLEERVNFRTALITSGRIARFSAQLLFNYAALWVLWETGALRVSGVTAVGGLLGAAALTTCASQGAQFLGIFLSNRGIGNLNRNVQFGLSANVVATALGTAGLPFAREVFLAAGIGFGTLVFGVGLLSDLRGRLYPKRGIGVFFGTFNPFHTTHLALVQRALDQRRLDKVIVHPTVLPRFHRIALEKGEIAITGVENGFQVMACTDKADANVNYFPTGNKFLPPETRRELIELAIDEAGLSGRVEVAFYPDIYARRGFHGVLDEIRRRHPGQPIHGIHGSDFGGMLVRAILDECGWVYPVAVRRRDGVSATAIRNGAAGMTSLVVGRVLEQLDGGQAVIAVSSRRYQNDNGLLRAI